MKKNRILTIILCIALAVGLVYGIGNAFAASRSKTVVVVPVESLNNSWGDYENSMDGYAASGYTQDIYLLDTQTVDSVLVEQGQHVKEGDILLKYDATQTAINLEKEQLSREKLELQMEVARKNLATLEKLRPSSEGGGGYDFPDFPIPEAPDYSDVTPAQRLDENSQPYNIEEETEDNPLGTEDNPYRYLCSEETVITGKFLNSVRQMALGKAASVQPQEGAEGSHTPVYYVLEVREGNTATGMLKRAWKMDATTMEEAPDDWEGSVNLAGDVKKSQSDAQAVDRLDVGAEPYNSADDSEEDPLGSDTNPLRFLCTKDAVITGDFLNAMAGKTGSDGNPVHYVLEVRAGDRADGDLLLSWQRQGASQESYESGKEYVLSFVLQEKEKEPEEEPVDPENPENPQDPQNPQEPQDPQEPGSQTEPGTDPAPSPEQPGDQEPAEPSTDQNQDPQEPAPSQNDSSLTGAAMQGMPGQGMNLILDLGQGNRVIFTDAEQGGSSSSLISSDASYTKEELEDARKEARKTIRTLELDLRESDIKIKAARRALDEGSVKAEMDGVVGVVSDPENPPTDGTPFLTVISENGQYVQSGLNELYMGTIEEGDTVYVFNYMDGSTYDGTVKSVSPYPDTTGRFGYRNDISYYPMIITISDPSAKLSDGDYLEIRAEKSAAQTSPEESGKIYISKAFIRDENGQKYVFKDDNGKLARQNVRVGGLSGESYEVLSGLAITDYIAFPYGSSVKEGAKTRQGSIEDLYY